MIGIGKNYLEHAKEMGTESPPEYPLVFFKNPQAVTSNGAPIVIPAICKLNGPQVDYEGELAVIIGKPCKDVKEEDALDYVGGYAVANDVSARWWQKKGSGGQFCRGKSFDTFCPLSEPVIASQVADPQNLRIVTKLNGNEMQNESTKAMIFSVKQIIS